MVMSSFLGTAGSTVCNCQCHGHGFEVRSEHTLHVFGNGGRHFDDEDNDVNEIDKEEEVEEEEEEEEAEEEKEVDKQDKKIATERCIKKDMKVVEL